jgi:hypothetical protein
MPSALLLTHIETWVAELEREVRAFEDAVEEVEEAMEKAEQEHAPGEGGRLAHGTQSMPRLQRLEQALAKADHIAELVNAAHATLDEAICAAQEVVANEQISATVQPEPPIAPADESESASWQSGGDRSRHIIRANLMYPRAGAQLLSPGEISFEPLAHGATILEGRYRVVELLHARPRVNLYLAYRLASASEQAHGAPPSSLVAIREIILTGLSPARQKCIEQAAFEEFVAPGLLGSPRLPGVGDRISVERERHYLVLQLRPAREERMARQGMQGKLRSHAAVAVPLAELLLRHQQWPEWLDMTTAFEWGVQLCRIVARLHRLGSVLGDLDPATVLVSGSGSSSWAPVLLVSWPPALQFWPDRADSALYKHIFPIAENLPENAFAAPETLAGQADERTDVYSLGAILYLLFTRYAPAAAALRQPVEQPAQLHDHRPEQQNGTTPAAHETPVPRLSSTSPALKSARVRLTPFEPRSGMALVPPRLFNDGISPRLERLLLRVLALSPAERFPSVFALVEALEAIDPSVEFVESHEETSHVR